MARLSLVAAPLLAFQVFPLPGIVTLAMILPAAFLAGVHLTSSGRRIPTWELALLALLALSVLWGDDPDYSVERLRTYLPLLLATVLAASLVPSDTVMRCLKAAFAVIVVSSLIVILLDPPGALREGSLDLVVTAQFSKNTYGGLLAVALLLLLDTRRRANLTVAPVIIVLLVLNQSVTAWVLVTFLVAATYVSRHVIRRSGPRSSRPILAVMALVGLGGTVLLALTGASSALGALGKDPTLGRRTEIWAACWEQITAAPVLGHGAFTFLDSASGSPVTQLVWARFQNYQPPHPHNGLLDLAGQLGIVGVLVFSGLVLQGFRRGTSAAVRGDGSARTAVLCLAFVIGFGLTEPTYLGAWLVVTLLCVAAADPRRDVGTPVPTESLRDRV